MRISFLLTQVSSVAMWPYLNNRLDCRREGEEVSVGRTTPFWPSEVDDPYNNVCECVSTQAWACVPSAGLSSSFGWWEPGWSRAGSGRGGRSRVGLKSATGAHSPQTRFSAWGYLDKEEIPLFAILHKPWTNTEGKSPHTIPSIVIYFISIYFVIIITFNYYIWCCLTFVAFSLSNSATSWTIGVYTCSNWL